MDVQWKYWCWLVACAVSTTSSSTNAFRLAGWTCGGFGANRAPRTAVKFSHSCWGLLDGSSTEINTWHPEIQHACSQRGSRERGALDEAGLGWAFSCTSFWEREQREAARYGPGHHGSKLETLGLQPVLKAQCWHHQSVQWIGGGRPKGVHKTDGCGHGWDVPQREARHQTQGRGDCKKGTPTWDTTALARPLPSYAGMPHFPPPCSEALPRVLHNLQWCRCLLPFFPFVIFWGLFTHQNLRSGL